MRNRSGILEDAKFAVVDRGRVQPGMGSVDLTHDDYMTSREAAQYLHVNHRTLLEWARQGNIPAIPLGGEKRKTWLFSRTAIDEHLRSIMTSNRSRSNQETKYVH